MKCHNILEHGSIQMNGFDVVAGEAVVEEKDTTTTVYNVPVAVQGMSSAACPGPVIHGPQH